MFQQSLSFFVNWFSNPNIIAMGLAILFGVFWYALYRPPIRDYGFIWGVAAVSAILTLLAIVAIQIPLQTLTGQLQVRIFETATLMKWLYILAIPQILLSGFVQEAAKLVPVIYVWQKSEHYLDPKVGLIVGAAAGLGFGVFEAIWALNQAYAGGWTWASVATGGFVALAPVWERFYAVAGHIAFSALAGYGLAKERGWLFYVIAAGLHSLMNYTVVLMQAQLISLSTLEILAAIVAFGATIWALFIRHSGESAPWAGSGYRKRLHLGKEPSEYASK